MTLFVTLYCSTAFYSCSFTFMFSAAFAVLVSVLTVQFLLFTSFWLTALLLVFKSLFWLFNGFVPAVEIFVLVVQQLIVAIQVFVLAFSWFWLFSGLVPAVQDFIMVQQFSCYSAALFLPVV